MAIALTFMHSAIKGFLAFLATLEGTWVFTAPEGALGLAALAGSTIGLDVAGRTLPRVALQGTEMRTEGSPFLVTDIAT